MLINGLTVFVCVSKEYLPLPLVYIDNRYVDRALKNALFNSIYMQCLDHVSYLSPCKPLLHIVF